MNIRRLAWAEEVRPSLVNLTRLEGFRRSCFRKVDYALIRAAVVDEHRRVAGEHIVRVGLPRQARSVVAAIAAVTCGFESIFRQL